MKYLIFDFSRVILFPKSDHTGSLNKLYKKLTENGPINFYDEYYLNEELLDFLVSIKDKFHLVVFTSGELHEHKDMKSKIQVFEKFIKSTEIGLEKHDPDAYRKLAEVLSTETKNMIFIDDNEENILAAREAGLEGLVFVENSSLFESLQAVE